MFNQIISRKATFNPKRISGLRVWLDSEVIPSDMTTLDQWIDKSDCQNNFICTSAPYYPSVIRNKNRKAIEIDTPSATQFNLDSSYPPINTSFATIFAVTSYRFSASLGDEAIMLFNIANGSMVGIASPYLRIGRNAVAWDATGTISIPDDTLFLIKFEIEAASMRLYINSILDATSANASAFNGEGLRINSTPPTGVYGLRFQEIIIYNKILTAYESYTVSRYLTKKHNI